MTAQCRRELDANRHETPLVVIRGISSCKRASFVL